MSNQSDHRKAGVVDRASRRRRRVFAVLATFLLVTQGGVLAATHAISLHEGRAVDIFRVGAFAALALAFLWFLTTGGLVSRRYPELEDELVQANRARALKLGYWVVMVGAVGAYIAALITPLEVDQLLPVLISVGIAVPALRFSLLEGRGAG